MLRSLQCIAALLLIVQPAHGQDVPAALLGATIIDGSDTLPIRDGAILLHKGKIIAVGPRSEVSLPANVQRVNVAGKWITPGLIDAHVHFFQSGGLYTRPDILDLRSVVPYADDLNRTKRRLNETFRRYLASGVTTAVDAGGPMWNFEVRRLASENPHAPRVAIAGPLIATEPTPEQARLNLGDPPIISAATVGEARGLAKRQLLQKPDLIKIWGIGSGPEGVRRIEQITRAVVELAHAANVRVAVHATELAAAQAAVDGGADILVHSVEDADLPEEFVRKLKQREVMYVTTAMVHEGYTDAFLGAPVLSTVERRLGAPDIIASLYETPPGEIQQANAASPRNLLPQVLVNAKRLVDTGIRVAAGTDAGNIGTLHGPALHRELQLLAQAGLTPSQILRAATRDAAYVYSARPEIGVLMPGYQADLLVLEADPLADIANLTKIATVWTRGVELDPHSLIPPTPEAVVQLQLERYNAHDLEGFVATYADDIEIYDLPAVGKPSLSGKAQLRKVYGDLFRTTPNLKCRAAQRVVEGDFVVDQEVCIVESGKPPMHAAAIYQVTDGLIRRVWFAEPSRTVASSQK